MTMHLVRGMTTTNMKKRKTNRKAGWKKAQEDHEAWLKTMGVTGEVSQYREKRTKFRVMRVTSDKIPSNGTRKDRMKYTGNEIAGIVTTHKSNLMPIRRDNKQAAKDAAEMRRN